MYECGLSFAYMNVKNVFVFVLTHNIRSSRVICESHVNQVPAKDHPNIKIRICDICLFETDSSNEETDVGFGSFANEENSVTVLPALNTELVQQPIVNGLKSIDSILDNFETQPKENIKVELLKLSQQLRNIVNTLHS